jgi:hypothetical protein
MSPPIISVSSRQITSPSPLPPYKRVVLPTGIRTKVKNHNRSKPRVRLSEGAEERGQAVTSDADAGVDHFELDLVHIGQRGVWAIVQLSGSGSSSSPRAVDHGTAAAPDDMRTRPNDGASTHAALRDAESLGRHTNRHAAAMRRKLDTIGHHIGDNLERWRMSNKTEKKDRKHTPGAGERGR